jgi:UDP-N-acetyl-D-glucosamine dehydrogenase
MTADIDPLAAETITSGATNRKVVVVGQGYVGLPLAIRAVEAGYLVVGFDTDRSRVKRLSMGETYVEDVSRAALTASIATGRYLSSHEAKACAGFDVAVITVPTPLKDRNPDLSYIEMSATTLARYLRPGATVILESTTYPGTTEELVGPLLEEGSGLTAGSDFYLGYSPERIDPGNSTWTLANTPKVVSGIDPKSLAAVKAFYDSVVETTVPVSGTREAELAKLLENTFRHVNIALVNELAMFASDLDIDIWEAIEAACTKPFGFMRFTPGPGVGGHCLPIDASYLSWRVRRQVGQSFRFVDLANDVNDHMPDYVVRRITSGLNQRSRSVNGSRILLLGLTYKRNTSDMRESPAIRVIKLLTAMGADVRAADPYAATAHIGSNVTVVQVTKTELAASDVVVLLADHDQFSYEDVVSHARYVLDTRNRLPKSPNVEFL